MKRLLFALVLGFSTLLIKFDTTYASSTSDSWTEGSYCVGGLAHSFYYNEPGVSSASVQSVISYGNCVNGAGTQSGVYCVQTANGYCTLEEAWANEPLYNQNGVYLWTDYPRLRESQDGHWCGYDGQWSACNPG